MEISTVQPGYNNLLGLTVFFNEAPFNSGALPLQFPGSAPL